MKTKQLMDMMRHISPRYTEEAAARAAAAKPRPTLMPALGVTAGALMCTAIIGSAIYIGNHPKDLQTEDSTFIAEESAAITTATGVTADNIAANSEDSGISRDTTASGAVTTASGAVTTGTGEGVQIVTVFEGNDTTQPVTETNVTQRGTAPRQTTTTAAITEAAVSQTTEAAPAEITELLGDIDADGYLTYADYMLAWMYQYYLTLPETKGSYPQMLSAAQIAQYNRLGELAVDLSQYPADAQAAATPALRLDAAVTSLMQPVDLSSLAGRLVQYPAEYGNITDEDREALITGQYQTLADHAYLMGQYYILQFLPEKYGESVTSITSAQVDSYLNFLRTACIKRYAELAKRTQSKLPGDVDGDGYLTYADYLLLQLYADYQYDVFCHGDSALRDCPDDYAFRLTEEQAARGDLAAEPSESYIEAQNGYLNTPGAEMPESMKTIPAIGDNDCDALLEKLKEIYGNGDDTIKAADVRDYFKEHPEQYGDVTEIDMLVAEHGCYADMAFFRLRIMCWNYWVTLSGDELNIGSGVGIVGPSTDAQVQAYIEFLRTSCIATLIKFGS